MVLPYIVYTKCFLLTCPKFERKRLQKLQNREFKIALIKNHLFNTRNVHKEAGVANWENRARLAASRLRFKFKSDKNNLVCNLNRPETRQMDGPTLIMEQPHSHFYLNSESYSQVFMDWLPVKLRLIYL